MNPECPTIQERLALSEPLTGQEQAHLSTCLSCHAYGRDIEFVASRLRDMPQPTVPAGLSAKIFEALELEQQSEKPSRQPTWWKYSPIAAAVTLVVIAGSIMLRPALAPQELAHQPRETVAVVLPQPVPDNMPVIQEHEPDLNIDEPTQTMSVAQSQPAVAEQKTPPAPHHIASTAISRTIGSKQANTAPIAQQMAAPGTETLISVVPTSDSFGDESPDAIYYDPVSDLVGF